jgi:hypothetical protein
METGEELIAPCGMNCGVCSRYLETVRGLYKGKGAGCTGCRSRKMRCTRIKESCEPLRRNKIRFCYECSDFPCTKLEKLNRRYTVKYRTSLIDNLQRIQSVGLNDWLAEDREKWKCARCGGTVSIHNRTCYDCGHIMN